MDSAILKDKLGEDYAELEKYLQSLIEQRDAARRESIEKRKGLQAEVESLRALKATLFDKLGITDESDIATLPDAKGQADAVKQYESRVKRLENELTEKAKAFDDLYSRHRETRLTHELQKALSGHAFVDQEIVENFIRSRLDWQDDNVMYRHGETPVPLDEGVKLLIKDKPALLLQSASPSGSGWNPASQSGSRKPSADDLSKQLFAQVAGAVPAT